MADVTAQLRLQSGSFVTCKSTAEEGSLISGKMYRVMKVTDNGKYIVLDTKFCETSSLKGTVLLYKDRFDITAEAKVKTVLKELLDNKQFLKGYKFWDVRNSTQKIVIEEGSRTHILVKFGKIMGVKIAGGHAWFAGREWAESFPSTEMPTIPDLETEDSGDYTYVLCESRSEAVAFTTSQGGHQADKWLKHYDVYKYDTVYEMKTATGELGAYSSYEWATANKKTVVTYVDWEATQKPETKQRKTVSMTGSSSIESQILAVVDEHLDSTEAREYMATNVERLLNKWGIDKNVRTLEVKINDKETVKVGKVHFKYDLVLKCMIARTNVALVGGAGSGKTTTVAKAAEALELKFYSKSVSAQTGAHEFFGYQDANGNYVRTLFREAYENGGVFLLDEFDAGNPNVLAALNQATANEHCAFADGMITKHKDFICVMAGNTYGHGANSEYVGRNKIDAATLDRFAFVDFPYDEDLEHALADNKDWCKKVQAFRRKVEQKKLQVIISPRATLIGCQLLNSGVSEKEVMELVIYKGMTEDQRNLLK